ncbi:MAG TPA: hypothetical protein VF401_04895 [Candidatus Saccharimonadales bacterium]
MGKYRHNLPPRNARHQKERNVLFDDKQPLPRSGFGLRRSLNRSISRSIVSAAAELKIAGDIASEIDLRRSTHATLLSRRALESELRKGNGRHNVGGMLATLERRARARFPKHAEATISGVGFVDGKILGVWIESPRLKQERECIGDILSWYGVPGIRRDTGDSRLHVSIGESQEVLTLAVRDRAEQALEERLQDITRQRGNILSFGVANIYPQEQLAA